MPSVLLLSGQSATVAVLSLSSQCLPGGAVSCLNFTVYLLCRVEFWHNADLIDFMSFVCLASNVFVDCDLDRCVGFELKATGYGSDASGR